MALDTALALTSWTGFEGQGQGVLAVLETPCTLFEWRPTFLAPSLRIGPTLGVHIFLYRFTHQSMSISDPSRCFHNRLRTLSLRGTWSTPTAAWERLRKSCSRARIREEIDD